MDQEQGMMLIDTDVLINLFDSNKAGNSIADNALANLLVQNIGLYVSVITEIEILQGSKATIDENKLIKQLKRFQSLAVDGGISFKAKDLIVKYSSSHGLMLGDSLIAASALHFKIPLFTFNKKDFRFIDGLTLYEP